MRSCLALKHALILPNAPATIDPGYRGELRVIILNCGRVPYHIKAGDRIAQMVVAPVSDVRFTLEERLDDTQRGTAGFGSTGRS